MLFKGNRYIVVAVVVGFIAVFAIHKVMAMRTSAGTEPVCQILVAEADITSGTALSPRLCKTEVWPERIIPAQTIKTMEQANGRVLVVPISKGEPILLNKLAPEGTAAGLGGLLQGTMRAFTIKVDDVSGVAGFISPGDRVDVLMSVPVLESRGEQLSKIILQDVKVLTAGQVWQPNSRNEPKSFSTVTLEVTPEQSEVLNLASTQGKVRLTLRSRTNKEITYTPGMITSRLVSGGMPVKPAPSSVAKATTDERTVEVIKGMNRESKKL
ncbi:MAG: Flp pilus assembly protein CpaB [Proteobacteria bacterium]|nr:Flp pilus assembly protein CpaB [Pseudomonadota bacterium]MBU4355343.1 Flp pilus assembly protein CpaB [Pseudomonadota bacterium]MBU4447984.1 Flp pilus assembly protein CpaB [Pseudomonadota bacterium]